MASELSSDDSDGEIAARVKQRYSSVVKTEPHFNMDNSINDSTVSKPMPELLYYGNVLEKFLNVVASGKDSVVEKEKRGLPFQSALENLDLESKNAYMREDCDETSTQKLAEAAEADDQRLEYRAFQPERRFQLFLPSQINCSLSGDLEADLEMNRFWVRDIQRLAANDRSFLVSLFYLMSTYPNVLVTDLCCKVLTKILQEKPTCSKYINCLEFATVLVNLGARFNVLNVEPQWTLFTEEDIKKSVAHHFAVTKDILKKPTQKNIKNEELNIENNLRCILSIMLLTSPPNSRPWKDAASMFLMLAAVVVDQHLPTSAMSDVEDAFLSLLDSIKSEEWTSDLVTALADKLSTVTSDHSRQHALVYRFPSGARGNQLKKRTVMIMLRRMLDISPDPPTEPLTLNDCLFLVNTRQIHQLKDYAILNTIVQLLDEFISCDIHSAKRKIVLEICNSLRMISNGIRDTINCPDGTNVKLTILYCTLKWEQIAKSNEAEKTVIDYM